MLLQVNGARARTVIFTQGPKDAIIVHKGVVRTFPVIPCPADQIVDLNGAGDAWLGGFLAYLVQDAPLETCVAAANYAANVVIRHPGCSWGSGAPTFQPQVRRWVFSCFCVSCRRPQSQF